MKNIFISITVNLFLFLFFWYATAMVNLLTFSLMWDEVIPPNGAMVISVLFFITTFAISFFANLLMDKWLKRKKSLFRCSLVALLVNGYYLYGIVSLLIVYP